MRDGSPPQQNIVHVDGNRSVLMFVLKNGAVSTLSIIDGVKKKVQEMKKTLPSNLVLTAIGDQSIFINAAIGGVIREGVIAAALTSLMILLFLGSFRSTLIIATSIPLSVLGSIATLWALGETLNIMTLGRPGARRGHSGRRGDGDDREHQLASRAGQGSRDRRFSTAPSRS